MARTGWLSVPDWRSESSSGPLMVLESNRRQRCVSGRAVYVPWTNGNCGVIMHSGGRDGRYNADSHQTRRASCQGGRQMWLKAVLTHWASVSPSLQGHVAEEADSRAVWRRDENLNCMRSFKCTSGDLLARTLCSYLCIFTLRVCLCMS